MLWRICQSLHMQTVKWLLRSREMMQRIVKWAFGSWNASFGCMKVMTDMPFGIRHLFSACRIYTSSVKIRDFATFSSRRRLWHPSFLSFRRNISSAKHISSNFNCISSFAKPKHIENPKDLYPVLSTKQKRDEFNRLLIKNSAFFILHY